MPPSDATLHHARVLLLPLELFERFLRHSLVSSAIALSNRYKWIERVSTFAYVYMMVQVLNPTFEVMFETGVAGVSDFVGFSVKRRNTTCTADWTVCCQAGIGSPAQLWCDFSWFELITLFALFQGLLRAFSTFYVVYCTVRAVLLLCSGVYDLAWEGVSDFPTVRKIAFSPRVVRWFKPSQFLISL